MKKKEIITNKFRYDIKCPEKSFEKYLDDMGVLIIDFFDTKKISFDEDRQLLRIDYVGKANNDFALIDDFNTG